MQKTRGDDAQGESECSIAAKLACDIIASVKGKNVEIVVTKKDFDMFEI